MRGTPDPRFMRRREWIALAALLLAIAVAAPFFIAGDGGGPPAPKPAATGPSAGVAQPTPTATPIPGAGFLPAAATGWKLVFAATGATTDTTAREATVPVLDLASNGSIWADLKDDAWSVDAAAAFILEAGAYSFAIEHDCAIRVFIDGKEVAGEPDGPQVQTLRVDFQSKGGVSVIRIQATDTGGPFKLKLVVPDPKTLS